MSAAPRIITKRYQIINTIGQGGMGRVYRAYDRLTSEVIALKHVYVEPNRLKLATDQTDGDPRIGFAREFQTLASLRHPNIISVLDYGFDEIRQPYFTMPLLINPANIVKAARSLSDTSKIQLLIQLLQALAYLHQRGIIHRDLKPSNVLATHQTEIRVMDFGLAVEFNQSSNTAGTLAYMAPEVLQQQGVSRASDLFAVGIIGYELFTDTHPFDDPNVMEVLKNILQSNPDVSDIPELVPQDDNDADDLRTILSRLMQPNPRDRYSNATEVIAALSRVIGEDAPQDTPDIRDSYLQAATFVGREKEQRILKDALKEASAGRGSSWLLAGESGSGKSRLMNEIRTQALVQGALVLRGHGVPGGGLPYQLWRQPLRMLAMATELSDIDAGILKEIVPDIDTLLGRSIPPAPPTDQYSSQQRLVRTITFLFRQQRQPVVLVLEDLHWTTESLIPLKHLNQVVAELPLLIVGSYRIDERPELSGELDMMQHIELGRLAYEEVEQLSESILGVVGKRRAIVDLLYRETEGNLVFLVEVVRALAQDAGRLTDIGRITLPEQVFTGGIRNLVQSRLERISPEFVVGLQFAATMGRRINLDILAYLLPDIDMEKWIEACSAASIISIIDQAWYFSHDKIREGLLHDLTEEEIRALHFAVGQAIEYLYPVASEWNVMLAYHFDKAQVPEKAGHYAAIAAEQQLLLSAYQDAITLIHRAISLTDRRAIDQVARLRWLLGNAHWGLGEYDNAKTAYADSLTLFHEEGDALGLADALRGLGDVARRLGEFEQARRLFAEALTQSQNAENQVAIGESLSRLGLLCRNLGDFTESEAYYLHALEIYERLDDRARIAGVRNGLGLVAVDQGNYAKAEKHYSTSLELALQLGNRTGTALVYTGLGWAHYLQGNWEDASYYTQESLALSREVGDRWMIANNIANQGKILVETGHYETAIKRFKSALQVAALIGGAPLQLEILPGYAKAYFKLGYLSEAVELLALAIHHPATYSEVLSQAEPLLQEIAATMNDDEFSVALETGKGSDLTQVVTSLT